MKTVLKGAAVAVHVTIFAALVAIGAIGLFCVGFGLVGLIGMIIGKIL